MDFHNILRASQVTAQGVASLLKTFVMRTWTSDALGVFKMQSWDGNAWVDVATFGGVDDLLDIPRAGDISPISGLKHLGNALAKWKTSNIIDMIGERLDLDPATRPIIYVNHNGGSEKASIEYDKTNKRFEFIIDNTVIGYVNTLLGFQDGAP